LLVLQPMKYFLCVISVLHSYAKVYPLHHLFLRKFERTARRNPGPLGSGQASYLIICGKELAAHYRSGESPSFQEGVLQKQGERGGAILQSRSKHLSTLCVAG
jgi:hypothetical protein